MQNAGEVAEPPAGIDSDCESVVARTLNGSFPATSLAPFDSRHAVADPSNEPPGASVYDAGSSQGTNGRAAVPGQPSESPDPAVAEPAASAAATARPATQ